MCQVCAVHLDCKLAPEGGGSDLGRVGMLLDATAVDINIFSFSSVTLGDSGYLIAQMCWGFCQRASQPLPDCHWSRAHTFIPPPLHTAHPGGTQAERAWGEGKPVFFAVQTSTDNLHQPQLPSLGAKTLVELGRGESTSPEALDGGGEWQSDVFLAPSVVCCVTVDHCSALSEV